MQERNTGFWWQFKNSLCVILSAIPFFGFFALLHMGKKTTQKQYTNWGIFYGIVGVIAFVGMIISSSMEVLVEADSLYSQLLDSITTFSAVCVLIFWPLTFIHTLIVWRGYLRYLTDVPQPTASVQKLLTSFSWRTSNTLWMIWSFFPLTGPLSIFFAGYRLRNTKLKLFAASSWILMVFSTIANTWASDSSNLFAAELFAVLSGNLLLFLWIFDLLLAFYLRDEYLKQRAITWLEDTHAYPQMLNTSWCSEKCLWQILTYFPFVGGIGISLVGKKMRSKKVLITGLVFTLLYVLLFITLALLGRYLTEQTGLSEQEAAATGIYEALNSGFTFIFFSILLYGTAIRWDCLKACAQAMPNTQPQYKPAAEHAPIPVAFSQPAASHCAPVFPQPSPAAVLQQETLIDINRCALSELTTLPGVSVADAKRAIEYRVTYGGFSSVDAFIDILQIKPHFAVQIFRMTTASHPSTPPSDPTPTSPTSGRIFDL